MSKLEEPPKEKPFEADLSPEELAELREINNLILKEGWQYSGNEAVTTKEGGNLYKVVLKKKGLPDKEYLLKRPYWMGVAQGKPFRFRNKDRDRH